MSASPPVPASENPAFDSHRFRQVLGHYPTGVTIVTALGSDRTPVGMAVGSFTSVSLDPPLVAFFPEKTSSTFPAIRESGSFCVNVLAAHQEDVCRSFAMRDHDRFSGVDWRPASSGSPVLDDVVAWIDCDIVGVHEYGDHFLVVGHVRHLDVESSTLPLTFFRGGYGKSTPHSLVAAAEPDLARSVRFSELARPELERLANEINTECSVSSNVDGNLVLLASAGAPDTETGPPMVGRRIPMLPPIGSQFMAWEDTRTQAEWLSRTGTSLDHETRAAYDHTLAEVRARGWIGYRSDTGFAHVDRFARLSANDSTPEAIEAFERACRDLDPGFDLLDFDTGELLPVSRIIVPVLDGNRHAVLAINAHLDGTPRSGHELTAVLQAVRRAADAVSGVVGGRLDS